MVKINSIVCLSKLYVAVFELIFLQITLYDARKGYVSTEEGFAINSGLMVKADVSITEVDADFGTIIDKLIFKAAYHVVFFCMFE